VRRLRLVHAIHDFLPTHRAGSEIYAFELCRALAARGHDVFVVAAEYDPAARHGAIRWRAFEGLPVVEVVNNWESGCFSDTYASPRITAQLGHVLAATRPDLLHVHNLLNLSFDLPRLARRGGVPIAATLHDYTLICASGGQRVHAAESHVCHTIDPERCSRCFAVTPFRAQMAAAALGTAPGGRLLQRAAAGARRILPVIVDGAARRLPLAPAASPADIAARLARARQVLGDIDLFVAPSASIGSEFVRLGAAPERMEVSDYGFARQAPVPRGLRHGPVRIGFIGSMVWHKGAHVLLEAVRLLNGPFEVMVAGDSQVGPEYHARLQRAAAGLPVRFQGRFEHADLPRVYGALDVLVVPSLWPENSPLVIHEAFMHGVAVVGARQGGIPGLVADGVNGFIYDAFSAAALAAVLQQFVDDPGLAARLAARAPAVKSIEEDAREWEGRYATLVHAGTTRPA
jgi:glycosyltransferase involved in cell wall biosynthesis